MRIKIATIVMVILFLLMCTAGCACSSDVESRIYSVFRNYRVALIEDKTRAVTYFDRSVLETSLSSLLKSEKGVIEHNRKAESTLIFFGDRVGYIFSKNVKCLGSKCYLDLLFKKREDSPFMRVIVEYSLSGTEMPLISGVELYWQEIKAPPGVKLIDSFVETQK